MPFDRSSQRKWYKVQNEMIEKHNFSFESFCGLNLGRMKLRENLK
jgi:hypothetical protein